jgi:hypothetical protein
MSNEELLKLQYPVGKFEAPAQFTDQSRKSAFAIIAQLPVEVESYYRRLKSGGRLKEPYRPGGWNGQQVIHHIADSHMNAYIRFKLTLTEDKPTIKPYKEDRWANLSDTMDMDPLVSVEILKHVHARWVHILMNMDPTEFNRTYFHPESGKEFSLNLALELYAWHSRHHLTHLKNIIEK